jgi:hypothetical protein
MIWTAALAGTLSLIGWSELRAQNLPTWAIAVSVTECILTAAAITTTGFGVAWRVHGLDVPSEPGHWMVIQTAIGAACMAAIALLFGKFEPADGEQWFWMLSPEWVQIAVRWLSPVTSALLGLLNVLIAF